MGTASIVNKIIVVYSTIVETRNTVCIKYAYASFASIRLRLQLNK